MVGGRDNGDRFPELFALIEEYAGGDDERQATALKGIGGAYLPSLEARGSRDAKREVDRILERRDYFVPHGKSGGVHPQSVYAVLNVAKHGGKGEDLRWGASRLFRMVEALGRRARNGESYPKHEIEAILRYNPNAEVELVADGPTMALAGHRNALLGLLVQRGLGVAVGNDTWKVWRPRPKMRLRKLPAGRAGV